jgi:multisubunit Na+/H+ antiporter MnhC subunit
MVLTSIVIGLGLTALMVAIALRLYDRYKTFDMNEIRRLRG